MATIETICTNCKHSKICKYKLNALKLSSKIENDLKIEIDDPFSIHLQCEHRREQVLNPRFVTEVK